jgi:hypothetical protein
MKAVLLQPYQLGHILSTRRRSLKLSQAALAATLAMAVRGKNRHYLLKSIQRRHFNALAVQCGLGMDAEALIAGILASTPAVVEAAQ